MVISTTRWLLTLTSACDIKTQINAATVVRKEAGDYYLWTTRRDGDNTLCMGYDTVPRQKAWDLEPALTHFTAHLRDNHLQPDHPGVPALHTRLCEVREPRLARLAQHGFLLSFPRAVAVVRPSSNVEGHSSTTATKVSLMQLY